MATLAETIKQVWRDFSTYGLPVTGVHDPVKAEIRALMNQVNAALVTLGVAAGGAITVKYSTRALLFADLAHDAATLAIVYDDATTAYNGIYAKVGGTGTGSWDLTDVALPAGFAADLATALAGLETVAAAVTEAEAAQAAAEAARDLAQAAAGGITEPVVEIIEAAGAAQVVLVEAEGTGQIAAVNAAGVVQIGAVAATPGASQYASTADALSNGVASVASLVGGSGGTNGTFALAFSGGAGSGAAGVFTVAGGAVTSVTLTARGRGYTSAPTISFAASSGLTGASALAVIAQNQPAGTFYVVPVSTGFELFKVDSGGTTATSQGVYASYAQLATALATINAKIAFFPGGADLLFQSSGAAASLYVASGASINITATDIEHPAIDALQLNSPIALPGPPSYAVFDDGTHIVTVYQADQDAIAANTASVAALSGISAAFTSGEMASTSNILVIGDSLTTSSQGFLNELTAYYGGRTVTGQGVGGQQAAAVAARLGVAGTLTVSGSSIPASGSGVTCTGLSPDPFQASIGDPASFLATVGDVPGVLSKTGGVVTFTRSDTGGAISASGSVAYRIRSTFAANTTASGATLLSSLLNRLLVLRVGHNDVFNDVIRDLASYSRQAVKDWITAAVARQSSAADRAVVCGITRGYSWLTQARVDALLGGGSGVTGYAADDAETIEAVIEANALNQWMADTFPGFADLMGAYVTAGYTTSINLGSSHVYPFIDATRLPDGTHGADGGTAQNLDVTTIAAVITAKGW